jgi:hypothetical protein
MGSNRIRGDLLVSAVALATLSIVTSCASLHSTPDDLQALGSDEGVVFGSIRMDADAVDEDDSGWEFIKAPRAGGLGFDVVVNADTINPFTPDYHLTATVGTEVVFIKKFGAGDYLIESIRAKQGTGELVVPVRYQFTVTPGKTTYIGKLLVHLPARVAAFERVGLGIENDREAAISQLGSSYDPVMRDVIDDLATPMPTGFFDRLFL